MRISDWSSDVCSSDLRHRHGAIHAQRAHGPGDARLRQEVLRRNREDAERSRRQGPRRQAFSRGDEWRHFHHHQRWRVRLLDVDADPQHAAVGDRSEEHTSELQSLMRSSYAVFCLKKKNKIETIKQTIITSTHIQSTNTNK